MNAKEKKQSNNEMETKQYDSECVCFALIKYNKNNSTQQHKYTQTQRHNTT